MFRRMMAAALLAGAAPGSAAFQGSAPPTQAEQAAIADALRRGKKVFDYDRAAWHSTDALRADLPANQQALVRGWIVTEAGSGHRATYFGRDAGGPFALYSAIWDGTALKDRRVIAPEAKQRLSAEQLRLVAAFDLAKPMAPRLPRCGQAPFNSVVLPGKTGFDPVSVYFLTPQSQSGAWPFGGHYRIDINNGKVVGQRKFANSCITIDAKKVPKGARPAALFFITHLLDAVPTEVHVFTALASRSLVAVRVQGGKTYGVYSANGQPKVMVAGRK